MSNLRIVITGGHATPAFATIEALKREGCEFHWFGEKESVHGTGSKTLEYQFVPEKGIKFYPIHSVKLHKENYLKTIINFWKLPVGFIESFYYLLKIRPNILLSFGSYIAVPPAFAAKLLGIPIVTHEQTTVPGLANKIVEDLATKVAITFQESAKEFDSKKVVLTGNPIRPEFFSGRKTKKSGKNIFITGGSRGSHIINETVKEILPELLKDFKVDHQTGAIDQSYLLEAKNNLPEDLSKRYEVASNYSPEEFVDKLKNADIVVSRAGANTVLEIAALGIPAVLIPIPWSGGGEQLKNARILEETGLAVVVEQDTLTPAKLLIAIKDLRSRKFSEAQANAKKLVREDAAKELSDLVIRTAKK